MTEPTPAEAFAPLTPDVTAYVPLEDHRRVEAQRDEARVEARSVRAEFDHFKRLVRETAIQVAADQGWCRSGLNGTLQELGLEKVPEYFEVEVEVTARQTLTIIVRAEDLEANGVDVDTGSAEEWVTQDRRDCVTDELDGNEWSFSSDDVDVKSVEVVTE